MAQIEPIIVKYDNEIATKTDETLLTIGKDGPGKRIIFWIRDGISAYICPEDNYDDWRFMETARESEMEGYEGENKKTFDKFVNYMIRQINAGKYGWRLEC